MLDVVVPCARPVQAVAPVLSALARSLSAAGLRASQVTVVDDRPVRPDLEALVRDHGFRVVRTPGATGPGGARNVGLGGSAPWILFCDDDVEVDPLTVSRARALAQGLGRDRPVAVVGGLRPPTDAPGWLQWAYRDLSAMSASAFAPEGPIPPAHLCAALLLMRRDALAAAGGFPQLRTWEDVVLSLRLPAPAPGELVLRDIGLSGVHHNVPASLSVWLERQHDAGRRLAALRAEIAPDEYAAVLDALNMTGGWRALLKRGVARLPPAAWLRAPGRLGFRLASSVAFLRGYATGGASTTAREPGGRV